MESILINIKPAEIKAKELKKCSRDGINCQARIEFPAFIDQSVQLSVNKNKIQRKKKTERITRKGLSAFQNISTT